MGWSAVFLLLLWQRAGGVFLATSNETISIPLNYPLSVPFAEVLGVREEDGDLSPLLLGSDGRFSFNVSTGQMSLLTPLDSGSLGRTVNCPILAESSRPIGNINLLVTNSSSICRADRGLCFHSYTSSPLLFKLPESVAVGSKFARLLPLVPYHLCTDFRVSYSLHVESGESVTDVDLTTGYLYLRSSLDAETKTEHHFEVICTVQQEGYKDTLSYKMSAVIQVLDVDDNAPYLQDGKSTIVDVDVEHFKQGNSHPFRVLDNDSKDVNDIDVRIENDELNLFEVLDTVTFNVASRGAILKQADVVAKLPLTFPEESYNFSVIFEDVSLRNSEENKIVFQVRVNNRTTPPDYLSQYYVSINKEAAQYSRVFQPFHVDPSHGYTFELLPPDSENMFAITPKTGIIYLVDDKGLKRSQQSTISLSIGWNSSTQSIGQSLVLINLTENYVNSTNVHCDSMCSKYENELKCVSHCGHGASNGHCTWRNFTGKNYLSTKYATCSPDLATCPNKECDELEDTYNICPQDCAKDIKGEAISPPNGRGINLALGTCLCISTSSCTCLRHTNTTNLRPSSRPHVIEEPGNFSVGRTSTQPYPPNRSVHADSQDAFYHVSGIMSTTACGQGCVAFIFLAISCTIISCVVFIFFHRLRSYKKRNEKHKHVGSRMSLSVVPSDYVDERSSSAPDSQAVSDSSTNSKTYYDSKWELPREHLILEQILGEGEFGKVMKAQAWGINGVQAYTTVAIKMLKGNGSIAEQQDLISEFNMLKEVCHTNVIRLLAACTQKGGPFYIIVEYAEYGALRSYLRKSRRLEFDCNCNMHTVENPTYLLERKDLMSVCSLTQRDLLSFAWQISKGMAYLSDMKLVHRDLAARNVLLSMGKVIKISDFGLSRDVYEGDTYLKKSKGRVPVKWMALESLEDHIYTSKSDVWSFGVVLWEVVTLGAAPYPGVTPERLYQLLKAGYRMECPPSCSLELYKIMKMCWKENPHERPAFKELVQRFDCMLQETVEYLDLSLAPSTRCIGELSDPDLEIDAVPTSDVGKEPEYGNIHLVPGESSSEESIGLLEVEETMPEHIC